MNRMFGNDNRVTSLFKLHLSHMPKLNKRVNHYGRRYGPVSIKKIFALKKNYGSGDIKFRIWCTFL